MEGLLAKLGDLNVNLDTNSLVEIARYWFWKDTIEAIVKMGGLLSLFGLIGFIGYKLASNYGTGKWK